jgi:hypothetical protein
MRKLKERFSDDRGMTTAEYAVGTVAVAGLGGLFIKLLTSVPVHRVAARCTAIAEA